MCSSYYITCLKDFGSFHVHVTCWFEFRGETYAEEQQVHPELWVEEFMEGDNFSN